MLTQRRGEVNAGADAAAPDHVPYCRVKPPTSASKRFTTVFLQRCFIGFVQA
jgi:hypothetical protein